MCWILQQYVPCGWCAVTYRREVGSAGIISGMLSSSVFAVPRSLPPYSRPFQHGWPVGGNTHTIPYHARHIAYGTWCNQPVSESRPRHTRQVPIKQQKSWIYGSYGGSDDGIIPKRHHCKPRRHRLLNFSGQTSNHVPYRDHE